jgi:NAD+ diphosphatase
MIQDIAPHILRNEFTDSRPPKDSDYVLIYGNDRVFLDSSEDSPRPLRYGELKVISPQAAGKVVYLFLLDDDAFFYLSVNELESAVGLTEQPFGTFRSAQPKELAFASVTGCHLASWYERHRFCGRCGQAMHHSEKERALQCPSCGVVVYPRISPAVIVGITNGDSILLTRYAGRPANSNYALVAGFAEIGETFEETVHREVLEETGLKVRNIRYYKSQPWAFSSSLLAGFYCDLDGDDTITLDENELGLGVWMPRSDIGEYDTSVSLTSEMIDMFRRGLA